MLSTLQLKRLKYFLSYQDGDILFYMTWPFGFEASHRSCSYTTEVFNNKLKLFGLFTSIFCSPDDKQRAEFILYFDGIMKGHGVGVQIWDFASKEQCKHSSYAGWSAFYFPCCTIHFGTRTRIERVFTYGPWASLVHNYVSRCC